MSDGVHLLIPFAAERSEGCRQVLATLKLPHLEQLLARLTLTDSDQGSELNFSMPHERVLARLCGLAGSDGHIPWAAWQIKQSGRDPGRLPWARITLCHWQIGTDRVVMLGPQELQLTAAQSQTLLTALQPHFSQEHITLVYETPTTWLAQGELFDQLATVSPDRVLLSSVNHWLPKLARGALQRLQQELQMLLYTHEINEQRARSGLPAVNSFWLSDAGALPAGASFEQPPNLQIMQTLREAALQADWNRWGAAWRELDSYQFAALLKDLDSGRKVTLTLCGERHAKTWSSPAGAGWLRRIGAIWRRPQAAAVLEAL